MCTLNLLAFHESPQTGKTKSKHFPGQFTYQASCALNAGAPAPAFCPPSAGEANLLETSPPPALSISCLGNGKAAPWTQRYTSCSAAPGIPVQQAFRIQSRRH